MVEPVTQKIRAKKLGVLIKDVRKGFGLTKKDCAKLLGITSQEVSSFEDGSEPPSLPHLEALAFHFDVPLDYFWGDDTWTKERVNQVDPDVVRKLLLLRQKVIGVLLRKARVEKELTSDELVDSVGIPSEKLESYEKGKEGVPLPLLEKLAGALDLPIEHFMDRNGVIGKWATGKQNISGFLDLPPEIRDFVIKPVNRPYLEVAVRLSELSAEKIRGLAEGLLDITY